MILLKQHGKTTFVLGIQGRDSLVLGRVSECLCGYFILWEGARFIWGQSKTGVLHLASWWYATCHCQAPRSVMSAERPRVFPLAEMNLSSERQQEPNSWFIIVAEITLVGWFVALWKLGDSFALLCNVFGHAPSVVFVPFQVDDPQPSAAECLKACRAASGHPRAAVFA